MIFIKTQHHFFLSGYAVKSHFGMKPHRAIRNVLRSQALLQDVRFIYQPCTLTTKKKERSI